MNRHKYNAATVKHALWFLEFRKAVQLLAEGKSFEEIKALSESENIFGSSTPARADLILSVLTARLQNMDPSFYHMFMESDIATQKLFALTGSFAYDTLFFDFMYEVIREKIILRDMVLSNADMRVFFKNKQEQDEVVAKWTDQTTERLSRSYRTQLLEAGLLEKLPRTTDRIIREPILDPVFKHWLEDYGFGQVAKAMEGVR